MRFLLTGGNGFIGRNLSLVLAQRGHHVTSIVRSTKKIHHKNIKYIDFEIKLKNQLKIYDQYDCFIDLAWEDVSDVNSEKHLSFNLDAHLDLVKLIIKQGIKNIFILGSCFEYSISSKALSETSITDPVTDYGKSKLMLLREILKLKAKEDFNLIWGRLFYIFGKDQPKNTLYGSLVDSHEQQKKAFKLKTPYLELDYLHIDQATEIIANLCELNSDVGVINICSGKPIMVKELIKKIIHKKKLPIKIFHAKEKDAANLDSFWGDNSYLKSLLKYDQK